MARRRVTVAWWPLVAVIAAASVAPVAAQFGGKATRPQVEPPKAPVRQVIFKHCTSCHGIDDYAYNALDRAGWNALIDAKHATTPKKTNHSAAFPDSHFIGDFPLRLIHQVTSP